MIVFSELHLILLTQQTNELTHVGKAAGDKNLENKLSNQILCLCVKPSPAFPPSCTCCLHPLSSQSGPISCSPSADWQEVSIRPTLSSSWGEQLSTSNTDSLSIEGKAVARRGQEKLLSLELTDSTVGGGPVMVQAS